MKKLTKLLGIVLILSLVMSMGIASALAENEPTYGDADGNNSGTAVASTGSVTVARAIDGMTYDIYRILELESFNDGRPADEDHPAEDPAYSYKATEKWSAFISSADVKDVYVTVSDTGYVEWITKKTVDETEVDKTQAEIDAEATAFAKLAIAYAKKNGIASDKSAVAENKTAVFTDLSLGYYLVSSSAGALCSLDTTHLAVTMKEKNQVPTIEKKLAEDSKPDDGIVYDNNDADIGQLITYQTVINAKPGAEGYRLYDKMTKGLTFVEITGITAQTGEADAVTLTAGADEDYVVSFSGDYNIGFSDGAYTVADVSGNSNYANDDVTFLVAFNQTYLDKITADTTITVSYTAKLNADAVLNVPASTALGQGNDNRTILEFGSKSFTAEDMTRTHTYDVGIFKYHVSGTDNKALKDAAFVMTKTAPGETYAVPTENLMAFTQITAHQKYRYDVSAAGATVTEITTDSTGRFSIEGLDEGTYYLYEKTAPKGYNVLTAPIMIRIFSNGYSTEDYTSITTISRKAGEDEASLAEIGNVDSTAADYEVGVLNQGGTVLPGTGGIGTTLFYVVGGVLVLAAVVLLITKKRMGGD